MVSRGEPRTQAQGFFLNRALSSKRCESIFGHWDFFRKKEWAEQSVDHPLPHHHYQRTRPRSDSHVL